MGTGSKNGNRLKKWERAQKLRRSSKNGNGLKIGNVIACYAQYLATKYAFFHTVIIMNQFIYSLTLKQHTYLCSFLSILAAQPYLVEKYGPLSIEMQTSNSKMVRLDILLLDPVGHCPVYSSFSCGMKMLLLPTQQLASQQPPSSLQPFAQKVNNKKETGPSQTG